MELAKLNLNGLIDQYPYTLTQLRSAYPSVSFPTNPSNADLAPFGVVIIEPSNPGNDPDQERALLTAPTQVDGRWVQQWTIEPLPVEQLQLLQRARCDYLAFWDALVASTLYASIREQSSVSLPMNTLVTEFIALIGDAKAGRPNEAAIQASMSAILSAGSFTEAQLAELSAALVAGRLTETYSLGE